MQENEAFITIKANKEGSPDHVSCRLLNPSKTNIEKISKVLLDKTNSAISSTKINQWKNTSSVITWFEKSRANKLHHLYVLMWKISIHLSPVIYLKNRLNLLGSSSRFLMMIHQSLCRPQKPFFLKVQHPGLKRVVMRMSTFQWVVSMALKYAS